MSVEYCGDLSAYDEEIGCSLYVGGNRNLIIVRQGTTIDTELEASVQAAIDAGNATLIRNIAASIEAPSAIEIDSRVACETSTVLNYNRTAQLQDGKVSATNIDFYNGVNNSTGFVAGMVIIHNCGSNRQHVIDAPVKIVGGYLNPLTDEEDQRFEFELRWKAKGDPIVQATNPIFNT